MEVYLRTKNLKVVRVYIEITNFINYVFLLYPALVAVCLAENALSNNLKFGY